MAVIKLSPEELSTLSDGLSLLEKVGLSLSDGGSIKLVVTMNVGPDQIWDIIRNQLANDEISNKPVRLYAEYPLSTDILYIIERNQMTFGNAFNMEVRTDDGLYHTVYLDESNKSLGIAQNASIYLAHEDDNVDHDAFEGGKHSSGVPKESGMKDSMIISVLHEGGDLFDKDPAEFHDFVEKVEELPGDVVIVVYSAGNISEYVIACKNGPESAYRWLANKMEWTEDEILPDSTTLSKAEYLEFLKTYNN